MPVAAVWLNSRAGRCMKTSWVRDRMDRCSTGSVRAPSRKQRPAGCARSPVLPRRHSQHFRRATLTAALEAYLGRRTAARVLAGPLRRDVGETIRAALLYADLRSFTALSEAAPPASAPRYSCRPRNAQRPTPFWDGWSRLQKEYDPASGLTAVGSRVVRNQSRAGSDPSADEIRHDAAKVSGGVTPFRGPERPGFTRPISCRTDQGEGGCSTGIYRHTVSQQRGDQTCRLHLRTAGSGSP